MKRNLPYVLLLAGAMVVSGQSMSFEVQNETAVVLKFQISPNGNPATCSGSYGGFFSGWVSPGSSCSYVFGSAYKGQAFTVTAVASAVGNLPNVDLPGPFGTTNWTLLPGSSMCGYEGAFPYCPVIGWTEGSPNVVLQFASGSGRVTNNGCLTLVNNTADTEYYQFGTSYQDGSAGQSQHLSGCSTGITVGGQAGNDPNTPGEYMALYPSESVTVCATWNMPYGASNGVFSSFAATSSSQNAPGALVPCGLNLGNARCVTLCNDGMPVDTYTGSNGAPGTTSGPAGSGGSTNQNTGTNGGVYAGGTNNINWSPSNGGFALDTHMMQGFSALYSAEAPLNGSIVAMHNDMNVDAAVQASLLSNLLAAASASNNFTNNQALASNQAAVNVAASYTAGSNAATSAGGVLSNVMGSAVGGALEEVSNGLALATPNNDGYTISLGRTGTGQAVSMSIGLSSLPGGVLTVITWCRDAMAFLVLVSFVWLIIDDIQKGWDSIIAMQQLKTPDMSLANPIVYPLLAAVLAAAFVGILFAALPATVGYLTVFSGGLGAFSYAIPALSGLPVWTIVTALIPVGVIVTALVSYAGWKYIGLYCIIFVAKLLVKIGLTS